MPSSVKDMIVSLNVELEFKLYLKKKIVLADDRLMSKSRISFKSFRKYKL